MKPNITIIVIDTLRYDMFKAIADAEKHLEGFVLLDKCIAPSSWTLPSHASIFTGMYPSDHGAHETTKIKALDVDKIKLRRRTFVSDLNSIGYKTFCISANPYVSPVYGFDEFGKFIEEPYFTDVLGSKIEISNRLKPLISKYRNIYGTDIVSLAKAVLKDDPKLFLNALATSAIYSPLAIIKKTKAKIIDGWPIEKGGRRIVKKVEDLALRQPFFLFINLMEAHDPYVGSKGKDLDWSSPFRINKPSKTAMENWKKLYRKASLRGYRYAVEIIKNLRARFGDNQLIILTSDHGQCFGEHGYIGHGGAVYDELVYVPFAVLLPKGISAKTDRRYKSLVNIRSFISSVLAADADALLKLSSDRVFSESFGVPSNLSKVKGIDKAKLKRYEKYVKRSFG
ncbi:MAG: sulfatase-like hydrolase/transferase [Candidatus Micrarchaeia archaeon]